MTEISESVRLWINQAATHCNRYVPCHVLWKTTAWKFEVRFIQCIALWSYWCIAMPWAGKRPCWTKLIPSLLSTRNEVGHVECEDVQLMCWPFGVHYGNLSCISETWHACQWLLQPQRYRRDHFDSCSQTVQLTKSSWSRLQGFSKRKMERACGTALNFVKAKKQKSWDLGNTSAPLSAMDKLQHCCPSECLI